MTSPPRYAIPAGVHAIPPEELDLRPDAEIDHSLTHPGPITGEKNIFFFWHSGFAGLHPYTRRNVRAWHRRFSKKGWNVYVLDRVKGSALNLANFIDVDDPRLFPRAFREGSLGGRYGPQHISDLVRFPLLLRHGGVYADVGMIQIGDLDALWEKTLGDPKSGFEVLSYHQRSPNERCLTNYFLCARPGNPLFDRCHRLFLALWDEDGGRTSVDGMRNSPLLKELPLISSGPLSFEEDGRTYSPQEVREMLTDYLIQGQAITLAMGLVSDEDGDEWDGPTYTAEHVYAIDFMVGAQLINELTMWNGPRAFELMSLSLPREGEEESDDQKLAREIVERCLRESFGFKLAHGLIVRVMGETLGSLWRKNEGSDCVPGTYADWLRHGTVYWCQDELPARIKHLDAPPLKRGPLLREV